MAAPARRQSDVEFGRASWPTTPYRDIQMVIGEVMRRQYKPPEELPDQLLMLLTQVAEQKEND
jgi:hypothetical protein